MCGRYALSTPIERLAEQFHVDEVTVEEAPAPSWNVAPTREVVTVATSRDGSTRRLATMRWGLVPSWAKDPSVGNRMINARAETLTASNAYRRAFETRRCILPADGYYEWMAGAAKKDPKRPFYYQADGGRPLAIGGLWEVWRDAEDKRLVTCTIITTEPNKLAAQVHDRMPLLLPPEAWDRWLAPEPLNEDEARRILVPASEGSVEAREVGTAVSNVRNDGPELVEAVTAS
jgi:putative SOS response-associated peptidase YedK